MARRSIRFAAALSALGAASIASAASAPKVGIVAPAYELTLVDGSKISSADLRGQVVILNFWATWCGPCKRELPLLDTYYRIRKPNGLRIFAVATQDSLSEHQLRPLFARMAIPAARRVKGPYADLGALPTNFVIDRAGIVRYAKTGAFDLDDLNALLVPLLQEPAPTS